MKKKPIIAGITLCLFNLALFLFLVIASFIKASSASASDEIVAYVDDSAITKVDIQKKIDLLQNLGEMPKINDPAFLNKAYESVLYSLIDGLIIQKEANKIGISVDDQEIEEKIDHFIKTNPQLKSDNLSNKEIINNLNINYSDLKDHIKNAFLLGILIEKMKGKYNFNTDLEISQREAMLRKKMAIDIAKDPRNIIVAPDTEVHLAQIVVHKNQAEDIFPMIQSRLQQGMDLLQIASYINVMATQPQQYPNGDIGWIKLGDLTQEQANAVIDSISKGVGISPIDDNYLAIFQVIQSKNITMPNISKIKKDISKQKVEALMAAIRNSLESESATARLRHKHYVKIK